MKKNKITEAESTDVKRRILVGWLPPTVAATVLPAHAQSSGSNGGGGPDIGGSDRSFCSRLTGIQVPVFLTITTRGGNSFVEIFIIDDDGLITAGATAPIISNAFTAELLLLGDTLTISGVIPMGAGATLDGQIVISGGGGTVPFMLEPDGMCPTADDFSITCMGRPSRDGVGEISTGQTVPANTAITWSFEVSPTVPDGFPFDVLVSCDGDTFVVAATATTVGSVATVTNTPELLGCNVDGTIEVQAQLQNTPSSQSNCDSVVNISSV